ncbi:hypothetical protein CASFOL_011189 [Castilleja foliolosa]|uniref:Uncharacterized protein n=1 Tax=Castilleja foliolosa TaxID=1961234 RepID=A0ABD3DYJ6_9LAMI
MRAAVRERICLVRRGVVAEVASRAEERMRESMTTVSGREGERHRRVQWVESLWSSFRSRTIGAGLSDFSFICQRG